MTITQWLAPADTIVAGDMNDHHLYWRTDRLNTRCGTQLAEWPKQQKLLLLLMLPIPFVLFLV